MKYKVQDRIWAIARNYDNAYYSLIIGHNGEGYILAMYGLGVECPVPEDKIIPDSPLAWVLYG